MCVNLYTTNTSSPIKLWLYLKLLFCLVYLSFNDRRYVKLSPDDRRLGRKRYNQSLDDAFPASLREGIMD